MMKKKQDKETEVGDIKVSHERVRVYVVSRPTSPGMLCNRVAEKAMRELLMPSTKTKADKQQKLKHDPIAEFRSAAYTDLNPKAETLILQRAVAFKAALCSVNSDIENSGTSRAQLQRCVFVPGEFVGIYGIPYVHMTITRTAGMQRTPDIRTRAVLREWAACFDLEYTAPVLTGGKVLQLLAAAGLMRGVGDYRPEKGGPFGAFEIVDATDERYQRIVKTGGRKAQVEAMEAALPADDDTRDLLEWFKTEVRSRGREAQATGVEARANGALS